MTAMSCNEIHVKMLMWQYYKQFIFFPINEYQFVTFNKELIITLLIAEHIPYGIRVFAGSGPIPESEVEEDFMRIGIPRTQDLVVHIGFEGIAEMNIFEDFHPGHEIQVMVIGVGTSQPELIFVKSEHTGFNPEGLLPVPHQYIGFEPESSGWNGILGIPVIMHYRVNLIEFGNRFAKVVGG